MNDHERIARICERIKRLPEEAQEALCWVVENTELVKKMVRESKLTEQKIEVLIEKALEEKDYLLLTILLYKQLSDKKSDETE